jgi:Flp pilus assembly protein CpaB
VHAPLVMLSVRARRALVHPKARRLAVGGLALVTGLSVTSLLHRAGAEQRRWGATRPVVVATDDLWPGDVVSASVVAVRDLPAAAVPDAALADAPVGATVRQPILAGEPVAAVRLAPAGLTGAAALVPAGHRAVAVPVDTTGAPPLGVGDVVDVVTVVPSTGSGPPAGPARGDEPAFTLAAGADVVAVADRTVTVAVSERAAPRVAWAVANGAVVLTLAGA